MKKIVSAFISAALTLSAAALPNVSAAETKTAADTTPKKIVVLGDSIASGYGLSADEYNYGALLGDYYGAEVVNKAVAGASSKDLLDYVSGVSVSSDSKVVDPLKADTYVISIGGNDMMQYASKRLLTVFSKAKVLKDGYDVNSIPERPTLLDVMNMTDEDKLTAFASKDSNKMALNAEILKVGANISLKTGDQNAEKYDRVIETQIIPNIKKTVEDIKIISPDANIVVQDLYNPLQMQDEYKASFTGPKASILNIVTPLFAEAMDSFRDQLNAMELKDVKIADVYGDFTSIDENGQKYGWYFTKIQSEAAQMDIHPTQAGHVAIAAKVADTIGTKKDSGRQIVRTYNALGNKESYPAVPLETYKKVTADTVPVFTGDVNDDGSIDASDASFVLADYSKASTGGKTGLSAELFTAADVDNNKLVDASDASFILSYYALASTGKAPSFKEIVNG